MAEVKISALPAATTPLAGTELVPVVQGGVTKQVAAIAFATDISGKVSKTGDTMTGPLSVPAGASGAQVPQAQEIPHHTFPSGTKMLFAQTAAPTGWTKDTTHNNKALRVVTGTAGSGGTVGFTTAFANQAVSGTVGNTTLTTAQIPNHSHTAGDPGLFFFGGADTTVGPASGNGFRTEATTTSTGFNGGGTAHNHSFTGTAIDLAVQYVDVIIATKN